MDVETRPATASVGSAAELLNSPFAPASSRTTSTPPVTTAGVWHWLLALVDQALVSGTRFLATIIVGRFCGPGELGTYSLAFSLLILAGCFQEAILTTPYAIFSQRLRRRSRVNYAGAVSRMHFLAVMGSIALFVALALAGSAFNIKGLETIALVLAVTLPASLLAEFARRFALADLEVRWAVSLDAGISVLQLLMLVGLARAEWLSARVALLVIGISCLLPAFMWWILVGRSRTLSTRSTWSYWGRNWSLGRWLVAGQLTAAVHGLMPTWLLAMTVGSGAAGEFAACLNLALLVNPLIMAVGNLLTPRAAQALAHGGPVAFRRVVFQVQKYLVALVAAFALMLALGGNRFIHLIYGESFAASQQATALLGLTAMMWAISGTCASALTALARPRWAFVASLAGTLVSAICIVILAPRWTVFGTALGFLTGAATAAAVHMCALIHFSSGLHSARPPKARPIYSQWLALQEQTNA